MIKLQDLLEGIITEGVLDKSILKCVFMAGGPGSGKSYVSKEIFGMPKETSVSTSYDMKVVNSDREFEYLLGQFGLETGGWETLDIDQWPEEVYQMATGVDSQGNKVDSDMMSIRDKSKAITNRRLKQYTKGRLGIIIDGTGHNYSKLSTKKKEMEHMGYDCYMVAVNTSLEVAKMRNQTRKRALPEDLLEKSWNDVQQNLGKFQSLFRANFKIVDNSKFLKPEHARNKFAKIMGDGIDDFIKKPVKNPIGKTWIKNQKRMIKNKKRFK